MGYTDLNRKREYQRTYIAERRKAWLKKHGPCRVCGSRRRLEVDHILPRNKLAHRIWSWSEKRREAELRKCQVLCQKCHKAKTRRENQSPHGTYARYAHGKCRCALCRKANCITKGLYR